MVSDAIQGKDKGIGIGLMSWLFHVVHPVATKFEMEIPIINFSHANLMGILVRKYLEVDLACLG
ncbi:hypothetical protein B7R77_00500 [Ralstonia solanacearum K60]|uniref:Uncharacterized protein n=1 Tax=Ralstonia solanacearum K60 TaxID=1091042 RepID=A0AAP7ZK35_RALSL|nr:hypothetical protein BH759_03330 [Ralstonia solanacearum]OYQ11893.1 hypothetical protein B7R77_00500 [Ralstonia solanacearum K60]RIJ88280.1 hypothetical protein RSP822_00235 [Ralstonia solanacearum]